MYVDFGLCEYHGNFQVLSLIYDFNCSKNPNDNARIVNNQCNYDFIFSGVKAKL